MKIKKWKIGVTVLLLMVSMEFWIRHFHPRVIMRNWPTFNYCFEASVYEPADHTLVKRILSGEWSADTITNRLNRGLRQSDDSERAAALQLLFALSRVDHIKEINVELIVECLNKSKDRRVLLPALFLLKDSGNASALTAVRALTHSEDQGIREWGEAVYSQMVRRISNSSQ